MKKRLCFLLGCLLALNLVSAEGDFMEGFMSGASFLFGGSNEAITFVKLILWVILFLILSEVLARIFHENKASGIIVALLIAWASVRFLPDDFLEEYGTTYLGVWLVLLGIALIVWLVRRLWHWLKPKDQFGRWRKWVLFVYALIFFILAFLIYKLKNLDIYIPEYRFDIPFNIPFAGAINTLSDLFGTVVTWGIWIFGIAGIIFLIMVFFSFIFGRDKYQAEPSIFMGEMSKQRANYLAKEIWEKKQEEQKRVAVEQAKVQSKRKRAGAGEIAARKQQYAREKEDYRRSIQDQIDAKTKIMFILNEKDYKQAKSQMQRDEAQKRIKELNNDIIKLRTKLYGR